MHKLCPRRHQSSWEQEATPVPQGEDGAADLQHVIAVAKAIGYAAASDALAAPGPVLVEAVVDPFEPPMPPKIETKQALHFAEALARGTPKRMKIATTILQDRVKELV